MKDGENGLDLLDRIRPMELYERLFDPPHIGVPHGANAFGRSASAAGGFVEIFLRIAGDEVRDAGFLTDMGPAGIVCASLACEALCGGPLAHAAALRPGALLSRCPGLGPERVRVMGHCLLALRRAASTFREDKAEGYSAPSNP